MSRWIPESLHCPDCQAPLSVSADGDAVECGGCGQKHPVVGGIPRLVEQQYLASFGVQWNRFEVAHRAEDEATFVAKTGQPLEQLEGLKVLDAGCGGGRYLKVVAEHGGSVVGVDHSAAVSKAAELCAELPDVRLVQADLKRLPFEEASFDFVFSIGVMHHDVETRAVFDSVARMVKPGGRYSVWLYRRNQPWQEKLNDWLRRRTVQWPVRRLERWSRVGAVLGGIPIVRQTLNKIVNFSNHPAFENRVCDTFDWYAPRYQHHHTEAELTEWFTELGFTDIRLLPPEKDGRLYRWAYHRDLLIGSGVNVTGIRPLSD